MRAASRHALIVLVVCIVGPGCRAMNLNPGRPSPIQPMPSVAIETLIDRHNRNASLVQSLEAQPAVSDRRYASGNGRMALVRPRDFKLTVDKPAGGGTIADIGSNDREFWIWSANSPEKVIYVGHYDEAGQPPPGLLVQPDWVTEALGLYVIPPEERERIRTEDGTDPSTITLVHTRMNGQGGTTIKKTLVDRGTGWIREHVFYGPDGKTVLARAWPSDYRTVTAADGATVVLPDRLRIMATPPEQEPAEIRITMGLSDVRVNRFDEAKRDIFEVPRYEGYAFLDLNDATPDMQRESAERGAMFDYETLPSPPAGSIGLPADRVTPDGAPGVRLGEPVPLSSGGPALLPGDPQPRLVDDLAPGGIDYIVGQRIPRPPTR